ncbi:uncharacterized protein LOC144148384 [Haemaphysalis longicornis]
METTQTAYGEGFGRLNNHGRLEIARKKSASEEQYCDKSCCLMIVCLVAISIGIVVVVLNLDALKPTGSEPSTFTTPVLRGFQRDLGIFFKNPTRHASWTKVAWYEDVNASDTEYTNHSSLHVCVFHANAHGLKAPNGVRFYLDGFPFSLCGVAVFCCPRLGASLQPNPEFPEDLVQEFVTRARSNRFLKAIMMLGDGSGAKDWAQFETLLDEIEAGTLDDSVGEWYKVKSSALISSLVKEK